MAHHGHVFKKHHRQGLAACLRELFQPSFWKAVHREFGSFEQGRTKWSLSRCWYMALFMVLQPSSTVQERFECAWDCVTAMFPKRKRCGAVRAGLCVAKAQRIWRKAARALAAGKSTRWFKIEIVVCVADGYRRRKPKVRRAWPERKAHESPKAPVLLRFEKRLKTRGLEKLQKAKAS